MQGRRIVDDDIVVGVLDLAQTFPQTNLLRDDAVQHDGALGFGQCQIARDNVEPFIVRMLDDLTGMHGPLHDVAHAWLIVAVPPEKLGAVSLLVIVDEQDSFAVFGREQVAHVDRGHGLADAAFQVCDGDDDHVVFPPVIHPPHTLRAGTDSLLR